MRKLFLLLACIIGALTAHSEEYAFLTFETTDGQTISVSTSQLSITISETNLTAGNQTFHLSNLSKMYFSTSDKTSGIDEISAAELDAAAEIYTLNGLVVSKDQLKKGVYIVKSKKGTFKIAMK